MNFCLGSRAAVRGTTACEWPSSIRASRGAMPVIRWAERVGDYRIRMRRRIPNRSPATNERRACRRQALRLSAPVPHPCGGLPVLPLRTRRGSSQYAGGSTGGYVLHHVVAVPRDSCGRTLATCLHRPSSGIGGGSRASASRAHASPESWGGISAMPWISACRRRPLPADSGASPSGIAAVPSRSIP